MRCEKLFDRIDELNEKYTSVWADVCNIESPTNSKEGVDAVGNYFVRLAEEKGWLVERYEQKVSGDIIVITLNPDAKGAPFSLSGHTDTVHPKGLFGSPAVKLDDEYIYGPGVCDCKGGVVAAFMAMEALEDCGFSDRPVMLLIQSDEEVGSSYSNYDTINYICKRSKGAVAFFNLEGYSAGKATVERKGIVTFTFKIEGIEAHSSNCAKKGANAIVEAAHKIIELDKIKDDDGLTCNCGTIKGGSVVNTVPGSCEFKANVRYATKEQYDWICEYAQKVADTVYVEGCKCTVTHGKGRPPMERSEKNLALLARSNEIYAENGLPTLAANKSKGGSDAAYATIYDIPCIDSIGVEGSDIHSPGECAKLASLAESAKRIASVVYCI